MDNLVDSVINMMTTRDYTFESIIKYSNVEVSIPNYGVGISMGGIYVELLFLPNDTCMLVVSNYYDKTIKYDSLTYDKVNELISLIENKTGMTINEFSNGKINL